MRDAKATAINIKTSSKTIGWAVITKKAVAEAAKK